MAKRTWVQDCSKQIGKVTSDSMNEKIRLNGFPASSFYALGDSKCGDPDTVGIYFVDPTADNQSNQSIDRLWGFTDSDLIMLVLGKKEQYNWTDNQLSHMLGLSNSTISRIRLGKRMLGRKSHRRIINFLLSPQNIK